MQGVGRVIKYQERIKEESRKYHKKARNTNWGKLAKELPKLRKDYGEEIK